MRKWRVALQNSAISSPLKESLLSGMEYYSYRGLGVLLFRVAPQRQLSTVGDERVFYREADETREAKGLSEIVSISQRFD